MGSEKLPDDLGILIAEAMRVADHWRLMCTTVVRHLENAEKSYRDYKDWVRAIASCALVVIESGARIEKDSDLWHRFKVLAGEKVESPQ